MLFENNSTNRMIEAIELFEEICNSRYFTDSSMILFLNKRDLFLEKISRVPIRSVEHWADYDGEEDSFDDGVQYFLNAFLETNQRENKAVYPHVTCATDTGNIFFVINACKDIILRANMRDSGF